MKTNQLTGFLVFVALVMLLAAGCEKTASEEIDYGTVQSSVYHNKYFGMSVTLPLDWSAQDQVVQQQLIKAGQNIVAGDDQGAKEAIKASEQQSVTLFTVSKYPVAQPVTYNPVVRGVADRVKDLPGIQSGRDYLQHARQMLEDSPLQPSFKPDFSTEHIGGRDFDVMSMRITVGGVTVQEDFYATIMKGYVLTLILAYQTPDEAKTERTMLNSLAFEP
jgi:hypothetical protein